MLKLVCVLLIIFGLLCCVWYVRPKDITHRITYTAYDRLWHEVTIKTDNGWQLPLENAIRDWFEIDRISKEVVFNRNESELMDHPYLHENAIQNSRSSINWELIIIEEYSPPKSLRDIGFPIQCSGLIEMSNVVKDSVAHKYRLGAANCYYMDKQNNILLTMAKDVNGPKTFSQP